MQLLADGTAKKSGNASYLGVLEALRGRILSGELQPEDRLPSFQALQEHFAAASNTVSRALMLLEQEGLIRREKGRGVFVAARCPKALTGIVGVKGVDFAEGQSLYWVQLLRGISNVAQDAACELLFLREEGTVKWEQVDGLLLFSEQPGAELARLPPSMPAVGVLCSAPEIPGVVADDFTGMRDAVRHLIGLGHRRIGYLAFQASPTVQSRWAGYNLALLEAGIVPRAEWYRGLSLFPGGTSLRELGVGNMQRWLADGWDATGCTALLVQNDGIAFGVCSALQDAGYLVPAQVSVVGFDGTEEGLNFTPTLTSVSVPLEKIGEAAMKTLVRKIAGAEVEAATLVFPTKFQARESVGPPPSP